MHGAGNSFAIVEQNIKNMAELAAGGLLNLFLDSITDARSMTVGKFFGDDPMNMTLDQAITGIVWR